MGDIKLFPKNEKNIGHPNTGNENKQSVYKDGIWYINTSLAYCEKRKATNGRRKGNTNSGKNQNARRKGNIQVLANIGSGPLQTSDEADTKEKIIKEYVSGTRNLLEIKLYSKNLIKGINIWAVLLARYSGPFLK